MSADNTKDERIELTKQELEKLIEKKIEEKNQRESIKEQKNNTEENISRRGFLKKIGLGTAGLGAMALAPAAADIKIDHGGDFILKQSDIEVENGQLDMNDNDIKNVRGNSTVVASDKQFNLEVIGENSGTISLDANNGTLSVNNTPIAALEDTVIPGGQKSFSTPGTHTLDVSNIDEIEVEVMGASGGYGGEGDGSAGKPGEGGSYINAVVDVSNQDQIDVIIGWPGENGEDFLGTGGSGGNGLNNGSSGDDGDSAYQGRNCQRPNLSTYGAGGGGGGSSGIKFGSTKVEASGGKGGNGGYAETTWEDRSGTCLSNRVVGKGGSGGGNTESNGNINNEKESGSGVNYGAGEVIVQFKN